MDKTTKEIFKLMSVKIDMNSDTQLHLLKFLNTLNTRVGRLGKLVTNREEMAIKSLPVSIENAALLSKIEAIKFELDGAEEVSRMLAKLETATDQNQAKFRGLLDELTG